MEDNQYESYGFACYKCTIHLRYLLLSLIIFIDYRWSFNREVIPQLQFHRRLTTLVWDVAEKQSRVLKTIDNLFIAVFLRNSRHTLSSNLYSRLNKNRLLLTGLTYCRIAWYEQVSQSKGHIHKHVDIRISYTTSP